MFKWDVYKQTQLIHFDWPFSHWPAFFFYSYRNPINTKKYAKGYGENELQSLQIPLSDACIYPVRQAVKNSIFSYFFFVPKLATY